MVTVSTELGHVDRARVLVGLVGLAGTAYFLASGSMELLASAILDIPPPPPPEVLEAEGLPPRSREDAACAILARNVFDSALGAIDCLAPDPAPPGPASEVVAAPGVECPGVRLVASWASRDAPERSLASLAGEGGPWLVEPGASVAERVVETIETERVVLRSADGSACEVAMFVPHAVTRTASLEPGVVPLVVDGALHVDPAAGGLSSAELDASITTLADGSHTIERSLIDRVLASPSALLGSTRALQTEAGLRIYGAREGSLLARLGVRSGDVLRTVNGYDLRDPTAALSALTELRSAERLTLTVDRRGVATSLEYHVR